MLESILTVVLEAVKCLAPPTVRQCTYLCRYSNNVDRLKIEIENIKEDLAAQRQRVDEAERNGEDIQENVGKWIKSVGSAIVEAERLIGNDEATGRRRKRCFKGLCLNLKARLQLGRDMVRQQEALSEFRKHGNFDRISYRSIPEDIQLFPTDDYEIFGSRMSTLIDMVRALKDPDVNMLGLYGMGGVGKTTLAKEVARQVRNEFDNVIFVEVSHSQDIRRFQEEIADKLGLNFQENSVRGRASRLYDRLKDEKRILVILDDIWQNLNLLAVGIPHGVDHKGCKVLLTARSKNVLSREMHCQQIFPVEVLEPEETWRLFKKMAGDSIEDSLFRSVAAKVIRECAGLPVSIVTIGRALRNKGIFLWKDALKQLRHASGENFQNIQSAAYSAIKFSYDQLEAEELKKIFLLIAYAYLESVDDLLMYGMGLGLFRGINLMEEARARVCTLVHKLKDSCMLLDHRSNNEERFSMNDVVRDVAISIAAREQNVLTVISDGELANHLESSDESTMKSCTSIVVLDVKINSMLREELVCPQLKLFSMRAAEESSSLIIPENFFAQTKQVRVLDLTYMHVLALPSSLDLLTNIRTLRLCYCKLQDIAVVGNFQKLEILSLQGSEIKFLSEEVGQLTQLKLLDLRECRELEVIPLNVLSKLSCLEELFLRSFDNWGVEVEGQKNASLDELKYLPNLTSLELRIKDVNTLPIGLFFEKLERVNVRVGDDRRWRDMQKPSSTFKLELNTKICLKDGLFVQLKGVEDLWLSGLQDQDVKYFVHELLKVGPLPLKSLFVRGCDAPNSKVREETTTYMQPNEIVSDDNPMFIEKVALQCLESIYLHSINVERIWQSQLAAMSDGFQNLTYLEVYNCSKIICLFSSSTFSSCVRLQKLKIEMCPLLEELMVMDHTETKNFIFHQLQFIEMRDLKKLTTFSKGDVDIEFPSLKTLMITECPEFTMKYRGSNHDSTKKVSFPNLEYLRVEEKFASWIFFICGKLKCVDVLIENESTVISLLDLLYQFHPIKVLMITGETDVYEIGEKGFTAIIRKDNKPYDMKSILKPNSILNNLERLEIRDFMCENLIYLVPSSTIFLNLTTLVVRNCYFGLTKLLTSSTAKSLVQLKVMKIFSCNSIAEIMSIDEGDSEIKEEIIFGELKKLELRYLHSLTSFCSYNCSLEFPSLETLVVEHCPNMNIFSEGELSTPKLQKVLLDRWNKELCSWEGDLNTTIHHLKIKGVESLEEDSGQASMQFQE